MTHMVSRLTILKKFGASKGVLKYYVAKIWYGVVVQPFLRGYCRCLTFLLVMPLHQESMEVLPAIL